MAAPVVVDDDPVGGDPALREACRVEGTESVAHSCDDRHDLSGAQGTAAREDVPQGRPGAAAEHDGKLSPGLDDGRDTGDVGVLDGPQPCDALVDGGAELRPA
ncbi:hypothetical protein GCM10023221_28160 [Luteimicrobium xylanilyticum]